MTAIDMFRNHICSAVWSCKAQYSLGVVHACGRGGGGEGISQLLIAEPPPRSQTSPAHTLATSLSHDRNCYVQQSRAFKLNTAVVACMRVGA